MAKEKKEHTTETAGNPPYELNFEAAMNRMEEIVERFDEGDLPLDEMEKLFTEGMALVKLCGKRLEEVEARLKTVEEARAESDSEEIPLS